MKFNNALRSFLIIPIHESQLGHCVELLQTKKKKKQKKTEKAGLIRHFKSRVTFLQLNGVKFRKNGFSFFFYSLSSSIPYRTHTQHFDTLTTAAGNLAFYLDLRDHHSSLLILCVFLPPQITFPFTVSALSIIL